MRQSGLAGLASGFACNADGPVSADRCRFALAVRAAGAGAAAGDAAVAAAVARRQPDDQRKRGRVRRAVAGDRRQDRRSARGHEQGSLQDHLPDRAARDGDRTSTTRNGSRSSQGPRRAPERRPYRFHVVSRAAHDPRAARQFRSGQAGAGRVQRAGRRLRGSLGQRRDAAPQRLSKSRRRSRASTCPTASCSARR